MDVGRIKVRKSAVYRVLLHIAKETCEHEDYSFDLRELKTGAGFQSYINLTSGKGNCGNDVLLLGLAPGTYGIDAQFEKSRRFVSTTFQIEDHNLTVPIEPSVGSPTTFKLSLPENWKAQAVADSVLWIQPRTAFALPEADRERRVGANALVEIQALPPADYRIGLAKLPPGLFLRRVLLGGAAVDASHVPLGAVKEDVLLEMVVRTTRLEGAVVADEKTVPGAIVYAIETPLRSGNPFTQLRTAETDTAGHFVFAGILPGDYVLVSISPESQEQVEMPGVLAGMLSRGTAVKIGDSNVTLPRLSPLQP
jgi:hypothetical protein